MNTNSEMLDMVGGSGECARKVDTCLLHIYGSHRLLFLQTTGWIGDVLARMSTKFAVVLEARNMVLQPI